MWKTIVGAVILLILYIGVVKLIAMAFGVA
jgi:hypothetical protein